MNDIISVNTNLSNISAEFSALLAECDSLEQATADVGTSLEDTYLWQSESRDKCSELHGLIVQYITAIRPMYEKLQTSILNLDANVDRFAGASRNVKKLW